MKVNYDVGLKGRDMIAQGKAKRAMRAWPSPWVGGKTKTLALKGRNTAPND
jgi:hypothetical protein